MNALLGSLWRISQAGSNLIIVVKYGGPFARDLMGLVLSKHFEL